MNTLIKKSTVSPVNRFWFDDFFTREVDKFFTGNNLSSSVLPNSNIWDDDKKLFIEVAIPGIKKEEVKIKLDGNILNISTETNQESEEIDKNYLRKEFGKVEYSRGFKLNQDLYDFNSIEAVMENGVLLVSILKKQEEKKESQFISIK